jgi:hypothetical protein
MKLEEAGVIWAHPKKCEPMDTVTIELLWHGLSGQDVRVQVTDAEHRVYLDKTIASKAGRAATTIRAGGKPGVHHIKMITRTADGKEYPRHGGFRMQTCTALHTDSDELNDLYEQTAEGIQQTVDVTLIDGQPVTHYKHADNTRQNIAYPTHAMSALRYFVRDMKTVYEALFAYQYADGSLPDHIYSDDYPCPLTTRRLRSCMADMETGAATTIHKAWQAHGDDRWVASMLPKIESAIDHAMTEPDRFDQEHGVLKRPHTYDYWDIHFSPQGEGGCFVTDDNDTRYVIMQGDTSSMYDACQSLAALHAAADNPARANHWRRMTDHLRKIGNDLFWDGGKYVHHIHLDEFDHGDFDESDQLAMSNVFAINRGFADHAQAVSIINEYLRRQKETGDRFPWWSLQPGYPDELKYFPADQYETRGQGHYCNGGLFPWVGAELCRAAFGHGMEHVARDLLRDYHGVLQRDRGALFTWYYLDGSASISVPYNQTNYDAFGFFAWVQALLEDLAGIASQGKCFEQVTCAPRWPATESHEATVVSHFPASDTYFAYAYRLSDTKIAMTFTGTGRHVAFRLLLPDGCRCGSVEVDGREVSFTEQTVETSRYVLCDVAIEGVHELTCGF